MARPRQRPGGTGWINRGGWDERVEPDAKNGGGIHRKGSPGQGDLTLSP